jgi:excisionase family DNA binding protein
MDDGFFSVKDVCKLLNVARETIRRWERNRCFPQRYRFSRAERGRVGFRKSEVYAWIDSRRPDPDGPVPA